MTTFMSNIRGSTFLCRVSNGDEIKGRVSNGDEIKERIFSFLSLQKGWHYGQGTAPAITTVLVALYISRAMRDLGARKIETFPGVDGSIMVSSFGSNVSVDVTIAQNGTIDYVVEENDNEIVAASSESVSDLIRAVREAKWLQPSSSDSSILSITARKRSDLPLCRSGLTTRAGYQLSVNAA